MNQPNQYEDKELRRKVIDIAEACKAAGFDLPGISYKGEDGGLSVQRKGYYDTADAVEAILQLITQKQLEARIDELQRLLHKGICEYMLGWCGKCEKQDACPAIRKRMGELKKGLQE